MKILDMMRPVSEKPQTKTEKPKRATNKVTPKPVTEKPVIVDNTMDELHCEAGNHKWQRAKQRGRKPFNCPLHQPEKVTAEVSEKPTPKRKAKSVRKSNSNTLLDQARVALDNPRCTDENRRAIKYIVTQIADGKRTDSLDHLVDRLADLIRRTNR